MLDLAVNFAPERSSGDQSAAIDGNGRPGDKSEPSTRNTTVCAMSSGVPMRFSGVA
jgi:hypothetical protein